MLDDFTTFFDFYITRSDWLLYFLLKTTNKTVVFECHKNSKLRKIILLSCLKKPNAKVIYLNENLKNLFNEVNNNLNSIVLHNGVDLENFKSPSTKKKDKDVVFVGNLERFSKSRNLKFAIDGFIKSELSDSFSLNIIGGPDRASNSLRDYVDKNYFKENINILGQLDRKETLIFLNNASIGILINDSKDEHSYFHSSPLKYFEYLASNLKIIASDFPAHKKLPFSENIIFYDQNSLESFSYALKQALNQENEMIDLNKISLDYRVKAILKFIER